MTTLPRKGSLPFSPLLAHTNGKTFKRTLDKFVAGPWSDHCERSASSSPPLSFFLYSICASYLLTWALFNPSPSPSPEQDLPRPHTALRQGRRRLAGTVSRMGTASCSCLCLCNCSLASICICDGPLAVFHNCAVVRRSSRLLLVAASLGVALLRFCCCCCRAFFDMWESVTRSCKSYRLEYLSDMLAHMRKLYSGITPKKCSS